MIRSKFFAFLALPVLCLTACQTTQAPAPLRHFGGSSGAGSSGVHSVRVGDTLYSISRRYKIAMRDIVHANDLNAPFALKGGQRLRLPPPQTYTVRSGDTLYAVSRIFNVSVHELAKLNNMSAPYRLMAGRVLTLPGTAPQIPPPPVMADRSALGGQNIQAQAPQKTLRVENGRVVPSPQQKPAVNGRYAAKPSMKPARSRPTKVTSKIPRRAGSRFLTPVRGNVVSRYGPKAGGLHNDGINIAAPHGTPVVAAENGVVVYVGNALKGSGNLVLVRHADRWMSAYAHLDKTAVKRGQTVKRGAKLGTVGSTGSVSKPQLHFELRRGTQALNPQRYL